MAAAGAAAATPAVLRVPPAGSWSKVGRVGGEGKGKNATSGTPCVLSAPRDACDVPDMPETSPDDEEFAGAGTTSVAAEPSGDMLGFATGTAHACRGRCSSATASELED